MKSGWHFVGKDKNPAGRHKKAEHFSEGTVLTPNKFMMKTIIAIFNQIFRDKCTRANDMPRMLCGISVESIMGTYRNFFAYGGGSD